MCTSGRPDKYSSLIVAVIGKSSRRSVGMTKAEILKREILSQYKSVSQFALEMQIPYITQVTALDRGI